MNLKIFFKALGVFVVLVTVAGIVLISSINSERNKLAIQEAILGWTGYELTIAGEININLFPTLGITLNDVRFRNPAFNQELASTTAAVLAIDILALLRGEIFVRELTAKRKQLSKLSPMRVVSKLAYITTGYGEKVENI